MKDYTFSPGGEVDPNSNERGSEVQDAVGSPEYGEKDSVVKVCRKGQKTLPKLPHAWEDERPDDEQAVARLQVGQGV